MIGLMTRNSYVNYVVVLLSFYEKKNSYKFKKNIAIKIITYSLLLCIMLLFILWKKSYNYKKNMTIKLSLLVGYSEWQAKVNH